MVCEGRMRRTWYYFKWVLRTNRLVVLGLAGLILTGSILWGQRSRLAEIFAAAYEEYSVIAARAILERWGPDTILEDTKVSDWLIERPEIIKYLEGLPETPAYGEDPAYERLLANAWEQSGSDGFGSVEIENEEDMGSQLAKETINIKPSGSYVIREKLADYDYLVNQFYSVHPTTTAGRDLICAENFLSMDLSLEQQTDQPQILIYHTHSQESFADYPSNQDATIVGVGTYLAELLKEKGYRVIHDTTVYDVKNGKLDRSQAYTYALDGIHGILQEYPSIDVVLDLHRDGVEEDVHLLTEVNGKPTARIMFFNGTSQTPDGPIAYLPNPNREANMAFSFQMQLKAAEQYPGFTRKIYLKGLRYNQHVRARTALIEVGAQTNTYAEALNAMEPLADILDQVLKGR